MSLQSPPGWYPDPEYAGYQRFWDGTSWTARRPLAFGRPLPPWTRPVGPRFGVLAGCVQAGILLAVLALVADVAVQAWGMAMAPEAIDTLDVDRLTRYEDLNVAVVVSFVVVLLVTGVLWTVWQYQVARVAQVGEIARTPGQHAGFWYIPLANLALGPLNVKNLWERLVGARSALVVWWWVLLVAPGFLLNAAPDEPRTIAALRSVIALRLVVALCEVAAGVLALQIVRTVTAAAHSRSATLLAQVRPGDLPPG